MPNLSLLWTHFCSQFFFPVRVNSGLIPFFFPHVLPSSFPFCVKQKFIKCLLSVSYCVRIEPAICIYANMWELRFHTQGKVKSSLSNIKKKKRKKKELLNFIPAANKISSPHPSWTSPAPKCCSVHLNAIQQSQLTVVSWFCFWHSSYLSQDVFVLVYRQHSASDS